MNPDHHDPRAILGTCHVQTVPSLRWSVYQSHCRSDISGFRTWLPWRTTEEPLPPRPQKALPVPPSVTFVQCPPWQPDPPGQPHREGYQIAAGSCFGMIGGLLTVRDLMTSLATDRIGFRTCYHADARIRRVRP